jgi:long-chain fatty acid transport protein
MQTGKWRLAGVMAAGICAAGEAGATGFELREQSSVGQGASFAGVAARADDPSMLFFNPAAMGGLSGYQAAVVGTLILPNATATSAYGNYNALVGGAPIQGSTGGNAGLTGFVPAGYLTAEILPTVRLGLSLSAPWGLVTKNENDAVSRYYALTSSLKVVDIAPAISWQPVPTISLGASLIVQRADARLSSAVDYGSIGAVRGLPFRPGSADGRTTISGDDTSLGWQIGGQWEPIPGTRLGAAYRSQIVHNINGSALVQGVPFPLSLSPTLQSGAATAKLATPATATFGLSQRIDDRWTGLLGLEWTNWTSFKNQTVYFANGAPPSITQENWKNTLFFSAGAEYRWNEKLSLRGGVAWDQTPVPEGFRTPRIPDNSRVWLSIGASYAVTQKMILTAAYSHLFARDATVNLSDPGPANTNLFRGNVVANYRLNANILSAQLRMIF